MNPSHYLRATYYEKWLDGIARIFVEKGVVSEEDLRARTAFFSERPDAPATAALAGHLPARAPPMSGGCRTPSVRPGRRRALRSARPS